MSVCVDFRLFGIISALILLMGCVPSTSVATNKSQDYTREPKKLFIYVAMGKELGDTHIERFRSALDKTLRNCGADVNFLYKDPIGRSLQLDDSSQVQRTAEVMNGIRKYGSDSLLQIIETSITQDQRTGNVLNIHFEATLTDMQSKKNVWKALLNFHTNFGNISTVDQGDVLANDIVKRMSDDGIFHSCQFPKA